MPADPVAAGRKGGASKSPAKLAACRRNGFQKVNPAIEPDITPAPEQRRQPVLITTKASE